MSSYYYTLFIIFTVIATMIVLDNNVGLYIILILKKFKIEIEKLWWKIKFHPNNFITTWIRNRQYDKIAKELEEEFSKRS
jgi:hypothetical protein